MDLQPVALPPAARPSSPVSSNLSEALQLLDTVDANLASGAEVFRQMENFRSHLLDLRNRLGPAWETFAKETFHNHPLRQRVHASPFSRRSYEQPRGYPGDAETLDYIYGLLPLPATSEAGRQIFEWEYQTQACRSVRERRHILAETIDQVAASRPQARMLSVACGHLREAELSSALAHGTNIDAFYALDQDAESLALIDKRWHGSRIQTVPGSVRSILTGKTSFADLDLVYAAGLYDYLADPVAIRLTAKMFEMLRSGGKLLVANFHADLPDIGGMETMMRWWLIYRREHDVSRFACEISPSRIASQRVFLDVHGNIAYLELVRS